jgi:hypothetical protein
MSAMPEKKIKEALERQARFGGWEKRKGVWIAKDGTNELRVERQIGGWVSLDLALGQYFKKVDEAKKAVERKLFSV